MKLKAKQFPTFYRGVFVLLILAMAFLGSSHKPDELKLYTFNGLAQGTSYHIRYYSAKEAVVKTQVDSILNQIDSSMSVYKSYSLISAFNHSKVGVQMDKHLKKVAEKSFQISRKSDGAFDITVYPLVNAWGFGVNKPAELLDSNQIKSILKNVGYKYLKIKNDFLYKTRPDVKIDVNGIAQGYSVDVIASFFDQKGINSYLIELGGEIRVKGQKPNNELFKVGIESVNEDFSPIQKYIEIDGGAVTTSGNYRKFHQSGNKKINHLIDPKTGYYLQNDLISVTVYAKDAITADGYDNVLMSLGLQKAMDFLSHNNALAAYFVYHQNGTVRDTCSKNFPEIKKF